jgi:transposase-like protein
MNHADGAPRSPMVRCPHCGKIKFVVETEDGYYCKNCNREFEEEEEE